MKDERVKTLLERTGYAELTSTPRIFIDIMRVVDGRFVSCRKEITLTEFLADAHRVVAHSVIADALAETGWTPNEGDK